MTECSVQLTSERDNYNHSAGRRCILVCIIIRYKCHLKVHGHNDLSLHDRLNGQVDGWLGRVDNRGGWAG